jgi:hypothetical protein
VGHDFRREVDKLVEGVGSIDVETTRKSHQVAEVDCLHRRGTRGLASELMSTSRVACVADDENGLLLTDSPCLRRGSAFLFGVRIRDLYPVNLRRRSAKVDTTSSLQVVPDVQEPAPE